MAKHDPKHDDDERKQIRQEYKEAVNMTQAALRKWLDGEESRSVGMTGDGDKKTKSGGDEAVGHEMGRHILEIAGLKQADLTDHHYDLMRKVTGYVHRHMKQGPKGDVEDSRWRYSLMNWGHDPLKKG